MLQDKSALEDEPSRFNGIDIIKNLLETDKKICDKKKAIETFQEYYRKREKERIVGLINIDETTKIEDLLLLDENEYEDYKDMVTNTDLIINNKKNFLKIF